VLGGESEVPTPEGAVRLKIPAGSQPGRKLRFKGRGLPGASGAAGDFYVVLQVSLPETLSAHQRGLWEELSRS
jgi:curved DNA-binding protein